MGKKKPKDNKLLALLLGTALLVSVRAPFVFAAEEGPQTTPDPQPETVEEQQPEVEPEEPKEVSLSGVIRSYEYGRSEATAAPESGKTIKLQLKGEKTISVTSESNGTFHASVSEEDIPDGGNISWSFSGDENCLASKGTAAAGTFEALIKKRPVPSSSDYRFEDTENIKNGYLEGPGRYVIRAAQGKKLSASLDGEAKDTLSVDIGSDGVMEGIYVYSGDDCSTILKGERHKIDDGAPEVESVSTSPANGRTRVKSHGIYSKVRAELIVKADIRENGGGLDKVYLISKKDGKKPKFEPVAMTEKDGAYEVSIALPEEETLLDADTVYLVAEDVFGHRSTETLIAKSKDGSSVTLEMIAPTISKTITGEPNENGWYNKLPEITATAEDVHSGLSSITIKEGGKTLASENFDEDKIREKRSLQATAEAGGSVDGTYEFTIEAEDNSGNSADETFTLKIDLDAPSLSAEGISDGGYYNKAPVIKITEKEAYCDAEGNTISAAVKRDGSALETVTFRKTGKAELDPDLFEADGEYTVTISAEDAAGNKASDLEYSFIKDSTAPVLSLENSGKANRYGWYNKEPEITARSSDALAGLVRLSISQDDSVSAEKTYERSLSEESISTRADVSSPSSNGKYVFTAEAADKAGNKSEKKITLKIDVVAPKLSAEGVKSGEHYRTVPVIRISEEEQYYDADGAYIRYQIKRNGTENVADVVLKRAESGSIRPGLFKRDGHYSVVITARDAAGNASNEIRYSFVKDSKAPQVSLTGVTDGKFYNKKQAVTLTVIEKNYKTNKVNVSAVRKLGGRTARLSFPWKNSAEKSTSTRTFSETGTYTVTASAKDKAGNASGNEKLTFTVDTKAPVISITGVTDGGVYTYGQAVSPKVTVTDDYLASRSVTYTKAGEAISNPSFEQLKENDGLYTMTVTATDKAGNSSRRQISFTVNRFGSRYEYGDAVKAIMGKAVKHVDTDLVITEMNVSKIVDSKDLIQRDGQTISEHGRMTGNETGAEKVYTHTFDKASFEPEGAYEINVISKDEAGNEMESKQENGKVLFYVDRTEPSLTVSGIDPKGIKSEEARLTVKTSDLLTGISEVKATVDGREAVLSEADDGTLILKVGQGLRQNIKVTSTDKAGNEAVFEDSLSVSPSSFKLWFDRIGKFFAGGAGALALLGGGTWFVLGKKKKKNKDDEEEEQSPSE